MVASFFIIIIIILFQEREETKKIYFYNLHYLISFVFIGYTNHNNTKFKKK